MRLVYSIGINPDGPAMVSNCKWFYQAAATVVTGLEIITSEIAPSSFGKLAIEKNIDERSRLRRTVRL